jgi:hypothetical protein
MSQTVEVASREAERRIALAPYVDFLISSVGTNPESPPEGISNSGLELERWEMDAVMKGAHGARSGGNGWEALLAEGVALHAKFLSETDRMETEEPLPPEQWEQIRTQLIWTGAIALALMEELQRAVDAMVLSGGMKQAKKLSSFRNKLSRLSGQIEERVGEKAFRQAAALAGELVAPAEPLTPVPPRLQEQDEGPPLPARFERHTSAGAVQHVEVVEKRPAKAKPLLIAFATVLVLWMVIVAPRLFKSEIPTLTRDEVAFSPAIKSVIARPPSLYLVVDGAAWEGMPTDQREDLVRQVGKTAEDAGYSGVNLRLDAGGTVGQWSATRGVQLFERSRERS